MIAWPKCVTCTIHISSAWYSFQPLRVMNEILYKTLVFCSYTVRASLHGWKWTYFVICDFWALKDYYVYFIPDSVRLDEKWCSESWSQGIILTEFSKPQPQWQHSTYILTQHCQHALALWQTTQWKTKNYHFFGFQSDSIWLLCDKTYNQEVLSPLNMNVAKYLTFFLVYHIIYIFPSESTCRLGMQISDLICENSRDDHMFRITNHIP